MIINKMWRNILFGFLIVITVSILYSSPAPGQYWAALPPYNTLWPLWSPVLSPIDPITGAPTPIVTSLTSNTVLPVQPGLTWDPLQIYPWLLYNSPFNTILYYDVIFGISPWPPPSLVTTAPNFIIAGPLGGTPVPIILPPNYASLPPTDSAWILNTVPLANTYYAAAYQYYVNNAASLVPLFPLLPIGFALPSLLPSYLDSLLTVPLSATITVPPVLSATAILGI